MKNQIYYFLTNFTTNAFKFNYISFRFLKSIVLNIIWLLTFSIIIYQIILIAILFSFIFFLHNIGFSLIGCSFFSIRSYIFFIISINFVIIDYISQFAKSMSFLYLVLLKFKLNFFNIIVIYYR